MTITSGLFTLYYQKFSFRRVFDGQCLKSLGRLGPKEFSARENFETDSARPERILNSSRPSSEEFSAQVGPARRNFLTESARPGGIFWTESAQPGAKWPKFQTLAASARSEKGRAESVSKLLQSGLTFAGNFPGPGLEQKILELSSKFSGPDELGQVL